MEDEISKRVFEIVDELYHIFKSENNNPEVIEVLLKAGKALNNGMPAQIVAIKTVNGISITVLTNSYHVSEKNGKRVGELVSQLKDISRLKGYKWTATGLGDLRIQFE